MTREELLKEGKMTNSGNGKKKKNIYDGKYQIDIYPEHFLPLVISPKRELS